MSGRVWSCAVAFVPLIALLPVGCGAQKMAPHMSFGCMYIEAQIDRDDIVVLDSVEGSSNKTSFLLGLIEVVDGDKLQLFWIKFFKDKYVWKDPQRWQLADTASRAYYKALEKHPEADAVLAKSWDREESGLPGLLHSESVTFRGKAVKLTADK